MELPGFDPQVAVDLGAIADLLDRYDSHSAARFSERFRSDFANPSELLATMDTNEFWGGAGSLADQGMCLAVQPAGDQFPAARRDYWRRMARIGDYMIQNGAKNPRLRRWIEVFREWADMGI